MYLKSLALICLTALSFGQAPHAESIGAMGEQFVPIASNHTWLIEDSFLGYDLTYTITDDKKAKVPITVTNPSTANGAQAFANQKPWIAATIPSADAFGNWGSTAWVLGQDKAGAATNTLTILQGTLDKKGNSVPTKDSKVFTIDAANKTCYDIAAQTTVDATYVFISCTVHPTGDTELQDQILVFNPAD